MASCAFFVTFLEEYSSTLILPFFEERSSIRLLPKETIKSFDDLSFEIPAAFLKQGITEYKEIFKLIVSTGEFDASLLQQDGLKTAQPTRSAVTHQSTLNLLMDRVYSREVVRTARTHDDLMTKAVSVSIVRSHDAKPIKPNEPTLLLDGVVEGARQGESQKSVPKSASTQPATESKKVNPKYQNQKRLSGSVVGAIALLVTAVILGLIVWKTTWQKEPKQQDKTSEALSSPVDACNANSR